MAEKEIIETAIKENTAQLEADSLSPEETEMVKEMMDLGVFYGSSKARTNPKMRKYILTNRSGFSVIDLEKTLEGLKKTSVAIEGVVVNGGMVLLVGIAPSVKGTIKQMADELDLPYVAARWLGGTLTNFETISKRINHLKKLKEEKANGDWNKYTKKEQLDLEKELTKLARLFGGLEKMNKLPQMVFVADVSSNVTPAKEAKSLGIPVAGIINTDANPKLVDYGIAANERNAKSAEFILEKVKNVISEAKTKQVTVVPGEVTKEK
ncbi:MAG: 30S ribosomal protein S2 [Parcubacteria group bacterium GW2011_GWA2_46_10]|nr:MAG: 30S ribosomal protein S2 [Parcubacteria group bacterium GW2011_GWA2_46_10]